MAVNVIGNQLVKLFTTDDFNTRNDKCTWDTRTYCQVVREEQTTMFQLQITAQDDVDLLQNGDFNSPIGWDDDNPAWEIIVGVSFGAIVGSSPISPTRDR